VSWNPKIEHFFTVRKQREILQMQCPLPFASYTILLSNTAITKSCSLKKQKKEKKKEKRNCSMKSFLPLIFPGQNRVAVDAQENIIMSIIWREKPVPFNVDLYLDNTWYCECQSTPNQFVWPSDRTTIEAASITAPCTQKLLFLWGVRRYTSGIPCSCCNCGNHIYRKQPMS